jgi:hypothetical protein
VVRAGCCNVPNKCHYFDKGVEVLFCFLFFFCFLKYLVNHKLQTNYISEKYKGESVLGEAVIKVGKEDM